MSQREDQRVRDVPRSCTCLWEWRGWRWRRVQFMLGCVWHGRQW